MKCWATSRIRKRGCAKMCSVAAPQLIDFTIPGGQITEAGLRLNLNVALQYIEVVAARHGRGGDLQPDGRRGHRRDFARAGLAVDQLAERRAGRRAQSHASSWCSSLLPEEIEKIRALYGEANFAASKIPQAAQVFERVVTEKQFEDFLTLVAYEYLE